MTNEDLFRLFQPHIAERMSELTVENRLVHYTSAEAAFKIISGKEIWLRNALLMNDFSEIQHGLACLQNAWKQPSGKRLQDWLEATRPGLRGKLVETFDGHTEGLRIATFMLSLSEHGNDEDELGRLSMWRAYGGVTGTALVLNRTIFLSQTDAMGVYSAPVIYRDVSAFASWFDTWVDSVIAAQERLSLIDDNTIFSHFFLTFRIFALCTKRQLYT